MIAQEKEIKLEALNCLSQSLPLPLINTAQTAKNATVMLPLQTIHEVPNWAETGRLHQLGTQPLTIPLCLESQLPFNPRYCVPLKSINFLKRENNQETSKCII